MITALVKNDIPETQIIQLSGHKNLHSLNCYKKASMEQQKDMSHILSSYSLPGQTSRSTKDNSTPLHFNCQQGYNNPMEYGKILP